MSSSKIKSWPSVQRQIYKCLSPGHSVLGAKNWASLLSRVCVPKSQKPIKHIYLQSKACSAGDSAYIMCSLICFISNYFWYDSVCLLTAGVDYRCCWIHLPNKFHVKGFQFIWSEATLQSEPKSVNQRYERAGLYQQAVVDVSQAFSQHLCSLNTACQVANVRFIMQYPCY